MRALKTILLGATLVLTLNVGVAHAQPDYFQPRDVVKAVRLAKPKPAPLVIPKNVVQPRDHVAGQQSQPGILPFTGAELTGFLAAGLAAVGAGTLIVRRTRSN